MYSGCGFYGIKEILLAYARLPMTLPMPVAVQHGWQYVATPYESNSRPPEIWVWSDRIAALHKQFYPKSKVRVVGSFFLYYLKCFGDDIKHKAKEGSVFFAPHSTRFTMPKASIESHVESLLELGKEYWPISVMLYYLDLKPEIVSIYEKAGFNVVSNGSLYDAKFMNRFMFNVLGKKYCIYNDIGSSVFYCSALGLDLLRIGLKSDNQKDRMIGSWTKEDYMMELGDSFLMCPSEMRRLIISSYFSKDFTRTLAVGFLGNMKGVLNFKEK